MKTVNPMHARLAGAALCMVLALSCAYAQEPQRLINTDVPYVPTLPEIVDEMLRVANVGRGDVVYDLGCGDGRLVIAAVKKFGAKRGVGVDIDPQRIKESNENAQAAGVAGRVKFIEQDLFKTDIKDATVVTLYLLPEVNLRLRPKLLAELKPGTRVVSNAFDMGDWKYDKVTFVGEQPIYFWTIPPAKPPQPAAEHWIGEAKAWRTIEPLKSTREDVEKLLGSPPLPESHPSRGYTLNKHRYLYFLEEGEVAIVFAEQDFPAERDCVPKVPDGTVLMIHVTLKRGIRLSEFGVNLKRFNKFDPAEPKKVGADAYLNKKTGFMFRTFRGFVDDVWYFPSAKARQLCPDYFYNLRSFAHFLVG